MARRLCKPIVQRRTEMALPVLTKDSKAQKQPCCLLTSGHPPLVLSFVLVQNPSPKE